MRHDHRDRSPAELVVRSRYFHEFKTFSPKPFDDCSTVSLHAQLYTHESICPQSGRPGVPSRPVRRACGGAVGLHAALPTTPDPGRMIVDRYTGSRSRWCLPHWRRNHRLTCSTRVHTPARLDGSGSGLASSVGKSEPLSVRGPPDWGRPCRTPNNPHRSRPHTGFGWRPLGQPMRWAVGWQSQGRCCQPTSFNVIDDNGD